jgi:hypothetical protein
MPATKEQCAKYRQRLRQRVKTYYRNKCCFCDETEKLELAHIAPTKLKGQSRGMDRRYRDAIKNRMAYRLMCKDCHHEYDHGHRE